MKSFTDSFIHRREARWIATVLLSLSLFFSLASPASAADGDESVIFLHRSTGGNVYGQGGVASWISDHNADQGTAYQISERSYPSSGGNYPYDYWYLWVDGACASSSSECLSSLAQTYDVIIFKHCYPGSDVQLDSGNPNIASSTKSLENYKLQYRALRDLMDGFPDNRFIVWTLAPLHREATSAETAQRARQFVDWVNTEWLTEDGQPHGNIFIFNFWGHAAESDPNPQNGQVNTLKYDYERSHTGSDSHPNQLANETIGPIFAQFIVDTIEHSGSDDDPPDEEPDNADTDNGDSGSSGCFIFSMQQHLSHL
jgi:hypothetical protein